MAEGLPKEIYEKKGDTVVLLFHAYSGSSNDVRMLSRFLERKGYSVYAPIFKGHGTPSPEQIVQCSPDEWWQQAKDALYFLKKEGFKDIFVFGLSLGGMFASLLLQQNDPVIKGGGSFSAPIFPLKDDHVEQNFLRYAKWKLDQLNLEKKEYSKRLDKIKQQVTKQHESIRHYTIQTYNGLLKTTVPFFLAQSGQDEMIPAKEASRALFQLLQSRSDVVFKWYQQSTHVLTIGADRKTFEKDVLYFIQTYEKKKERKEGDK